MMNEVIGIVRAYLKLGTVDVRSSLNASLCIALVETTACAMFHHALVQGIAKAAVILTAWHAPYRPLNLNRPCSIRCMLNNNLRRNRRSSSGAADSTRSPSAAGQRCRPRRGPRRPTQGPPPGPSARHTSPRTARTSDRGSHIVTSAGIAVPVLQIAPGTQVPLGRAAGLAAGLAGRPKARRPAARLGTHRPARRAPRIAEVT